MIFLTFLLLYFFDDTARFLSFCQKSFKFCKISQYDCLILPTQGSIISLLPFDQKFKIIRISISLWNGGSSSCFYYFHDVTYWDIFVFCWKFYFDYFLYFRVLVKQFTSKVVDKSLILAKFFEGLWKSYLFEPTFMNGGIRVQKDEKIEFLGA